MFELDGSPVTLEFLQEQAVANNMDFDSYLAAMKEKGLVEKTNGSADATPTGEPSATESELVGGSLESVQDRTVQPGIVVPEVIGDAPDLTMEDITMTDEERIEFDRKAEEQREKGIEGQKLYLREKQIQDKTGLLPSKYPNLQVGTE